MFKSISRLAVLVVLGIQPAEVEICHRDLVSSPSNYLLQRLNSLVASSDILRQRYAEPHIDVRILRVQLNCAT